MLLFSATFLSSCTATTTNTIATITPEQISEICLGMSLGDIEVHLGEPGQRTDNADADEDVATYEWRNADDSYLWVVFAADKAIGMGQVGLHSPVELSESVQPSASSDCPFRPFRSE